MLERLEWLSLPDVRRDNVVPFLWPNVLPRCTRLETLSIRGTCMTNKGVLEVLWQPHDAVCLLSYSISTYAPKTVATIEIRMILYFIDLLIEELKERRPAIKRIGIDLGVWIQAYIPKDELADDLKDAELEYVANVAACRQRLEAYRREYRLVLERSSKWWLPDSATTIKLEYESGNIGNSRNAFGVDHFSRTRFDSEWVDGLQYETICPLGHDDVHEDKHTKDPSPLGAAINGMDEKMTHVGMLNRLHDIAVTWNNVEFFEL